MAAVDDLNAAITKLGSAVTANTTEQTEAAMTIKTLVQDMSDANSNSDTSSVESAAAQISSLADQITASASNLQNAIPAQSPSTVQASVGASTAGSAAAGTTQATSAASDVQPIQPSADVTNT